MQNFYHKCTSRKSPCFQNLLQFSWDFTSTLSILQFNFQFDFTPTAPFKSQFPCLSRVCSSIISSIGPFILLFFLSNMPWLLFYSTSASLQSEINLPTPKDTLGILFNFIEWALGWIFNNYWFQILFGTIHVLSCDGQGGSFWSVHGNFDDSLETFSNHLIA